MPEPVRWCWWFLFLCLCIYFMDWNLNKVSHAVPSFRLSSLLRGNDITGVLDHTFCVEHNAYGEIIPHELKPNGKSISVTEETKKEYVRYRSDADTDVPVLLFCFTQFCLLWTECISCRIIGSFHRLYVNWRFLHGIEAQFLALQKGFNEVIPQHLLKAFDEKELEVQHF